MFRELMSYREGESSVMASNFCIGATFTATEGIAAGQTVAIDTTATNKVLLANSNDVLRRAVVGIAINAAIAGAAVQVAMLGRVAAAVVVAGAVKGDPIATTATNGALSVVPGAGKPFMIGTLLANEAAGVAPVWISPSAA